MRERASPDLCGGRSVMLVPTATPSSFVRTEEQAARLAVQIVSALDRRQLVGDLNGSEHSLELFLDEVRQF